MGLLQFMRTGQHSCDIENYGLRTIINKENYNSYQLDAVGNNLNVLGIKTLLLRIGCLVDEFNFLIGS